MIEHDAEGKNNPSQTLEFPSVGELMIDFILFSMDGDRLRISDFRGRSNLVLIFCASGNSKETRNFLQEVSGLRSEFEGEEAQVLVIVLMSDDQAELHRNLPFPVLQDENGYAHELAGVAVNKRDFRPVIYVIDRYGEIRHICRQGVPSCANAGAILEWVRYINLECPE